MNASTHDVVVYVMLQDLSQYLERFNMINMYATLILTVLGLLGNMSALIVFIHARNRLPHITGAKYLIMLTVANTIFLLIQFYISTYNRFLFHFKIDYKSSLQVLDSSLFFCKSLPYLRYTARFLNASVTAFFSLERLVAVYYPLKARSLKSKCLFSLKIPLIVSFILPCYTIFLTELVPNSPIGDEMYSKYNLTRSFNLHSLTPSLNDQTCSVSPKNLKTLIFFHALLFLAMFFAYLTVSVSLLAIIIKLKKSKGFVDATYRLRYSSSLKCLATSSTATGAAALVINSGDRFNRRSNTTCGISQQQEQQELIVCKTPPSPSKYEKSSMQKSFSSSWLYGHHHHHHENHHHHDKNSHLGNHKIHDTKILSSISISFVLLNMPYFFTMFFMFVYVMSSNKVENANRKLASSDLMDMIKIQAWILVTEIFQLANFSLTGLLFFCSGQIFRLHAAKCYRHILSFLKFKI